jgi:hypothetical protein
VALGTPLMEVDFARKIIKLNGNLSQQTMELIINCILITFDIYIYKYIYIYVYIYDSYIVRPPRVVGWFTNPKRSAGLAGLSILGHDVMEDWEAGESTGKQGIVCS